MYLIDDNVYEGDFECYIREHTRTMQIMDKYEGYYPKKEENYDPGKKYKRLIIKNRAQVDIGDYRVFYCLIVERRNAFKQKLPDKFIIMSDFKKNPNSVYAYSREKIRENISLIKPLYKCKNKEIYFDVPYGLEAQNKTDRQGYGWEWDWSGGIESYIEGTYYGQTSSYMFVGVKILDVKKKDTEQCGKSVITSKSAKGILVTVERYHGQMVYAIRDRMSNGDEGLVYIEKKGLSEQQAIDKYLKFKAGKNG